MRMEVKGGVFLDLLDGAMAAGQEEGLMKLDKSKWLLKTMSEDDVVLFACRVLSDAMKSYDEGDVEALGIRYNAMQDAIPSREDNVLIEFDETDGGSHKLHVAQGGYDAGLTMTDPEFIEGKVDRAPSIDHAVVIEGDLDVFSDFIKKADNIVDSSWFMLSPRPEGLYMYSEKDNQDLVRKADWDQFNNVSINWGKGFTKDETDMSHPDILNPSQDKGCDGIFSMEHAKALSYISDKGRLCLDNHTPLKMVFDLPSGVDASYYFCPRIPSTDSIATLPDDVSEERMVYE